MADSNIQNIKTSTSETGLFPLSKKRRISESIAVGRETNNVSSNAIRRDHAGSHRPVTSCSHCRQQKIKCNANQNYPNPCSRCQKYKLHCEIDPSFKPQKGSQLQTMRRDLDDLKLKLDHLLGNQSIISQALNQTAGGREILHSLAVLNERHSQPPSELEEDLTPTNTFSAQTYLIRGPQLRSMKTPSAKSPSLQDRHQTLPANFTLENDHSDSGDSRISLRDNKSKDQILATPSLFERVPTPDDKIDQFLLGEVQIPLEKANELHKRFVDEYLPYFPIMFTNSAAELYSQSKLLFWTVMLTACLSDSEPTLYIKLSSLIKQLAIETCWMRTPRSTHISQALLILCIWPLPNQRVLDDCSYRFVGLAKSLSFQLGLHRGKFMAEFTRSQTWMPNAEKWRTRTWLGIFFSELCWASILGLPPTSKIDYLVDRVKFAEDQPSVYDNNDEEETSFKLPSRFKRLILLSVFQSNLCTTMDSSTNSPDGLIECDLRASTLSTFEQELEELNKGLDFEKDDAVHIYYLYVQLMICCFAFLPEMPLSVQSQYVLKAYSSATKIVTLLTKLLENHQLIALPIYIRQSATFSAFILFKLQLNSMLLSKFLNSARQSIVTIHRLFRNQHTAWTTSVENDISRTASTLERLNMVLIRHPEVFLMETGIIAKMRSHLTGSLFYDLVWCLHEAGRRENSSGDTQAKESSKVSSDVAGNKMLYPLPLYNHIAREDFKTVTETTPGGTTVTTLVPTKDALRHAEELAKTNKDTDGVVKEINGIPISMLDETGSVRLSSTKGNSIASNLDQSQTTSGLSKMANVRADEKGTYSRPQRAVSSMTSSIRTGPESHSLFTRSTSTVPPSFPNNMGEISSSRATSNVEDFNVLNNRNTAFGGSLENQEESKAQDSDIDKDSSWNIPQSDQLNDFFQQQTAGWLENGLGNDDIFGWFDMGTEF
ncbi:hypothetical protein KAFR_0L01720 [Kazachstania africana CBS 2517]|uniref:Zn(2)-C6 fungal-type domain-containing protein n=1 Tax=Kazachstania africana (strain ATCC 22294 / BCRC 22015 / CBS 2517 / CECT 1963 / NBRC 1671 / NRRL Y-8276) TaxID=1071382 RepID=H2B2D2_KAZAF|nr:hypothetical protein KAFR_0L01720 [Kazachstania africana CBS 2517]CCF60782.1 hypothetical protein KAFR_0L01720 [Kazachstania africana CBS 2517]